MKIEVNSCVIYTYKISVLCRSHLSQLFVNFLASFFRTSEILGRYSPGATSQSGREGGLRSGLSKAKGGGGNQLGYDYAINFYSLKTSTIVAFKNNGCTPSSFFYSKGSRPS